MDWTQGCYEIHFYFLSSLDTQEKYYYTIFILVLLYNFRLKVMHFALWSGMECCCGILVVFKNSDSEAFQIKEINFHAHLDEPWKQAVKETRCREQLLRAVPLLGPLEWVHLDSWK